MVKMTLQSDAKRDLGKLPKDIRKVILSACEDIHDDWGIGKTLSGRLTGYRVHRLGVYRIVYEVKESSRIEIVAIGHRKDVYERVR
jgi:mRNA-degrading endonuclease RelE of RelBE toxin-antitoxin system